MKVWKCRHLYKIRKISQLKDVGGWCTKIEKIEVKQNLKKVGKECTHARKLKKKILAKSKRKVSFKRMFKRKRKFVSEGYQP